VRHYKTIGLQQSRNIEILRRINGIGDQEQSKKIKKHYKLKTSGQAGTARKIK
jgi:hypothetical protein